MSTCENCGKSFELQESLAEVTSLRVLCPHCSAERAAAKARKAALTAGGRPAPAPAKATAAPAPAPRPAPPPAAPRASAPPPAPKAAPVPKAAPMPAKKLQTRAEAAEAAAKLPAAARNDKPAPKPSKAKPKHEIELASKDLQKRGSREVLIAFVAALVVFAVAGGVLWKVFNQKKTEKADRDAYLATIEKFKTDFQAFNIESEEGATQLIAFQEEQKPLWKDLDYAGEVVNRTAKAHTFLDRLEEQKELKRRLDEIEGVMAKAAELKPSELADQLRRLDELKLKAGIVGAEFEARVDKDRVEGERIHLERLMATAEAAAATEPLDRAALATLASVEDDVFKLVDGVAKAFQKNRADTALGDKQKAYEAEWRKVMELSDRAVETFYTTEVLEAVAWRDLLADPAAWKVAEAKGFEHNIAGGTLSLVGPDPTEDGQGVMSIGDKEIWRDFVVEMEITIEAGEAEFFFRLPINFQKNVESRNLSVLEGDGQFEAKRTYTYEFQVIGSTLVQLNKSEESQAPIRDVIKWNQIRKGAFGIGVPRGARLKITKMRAKVLR